MDYLKIDDFHLVHDRPDNNRDLDTKPLHSLIETIESNSNVSLEKIKPTIVAIPTIHSHHQDHVHVHHACIAALRPISTPVADVEIDDVIENKINAFYKYKSQVRQGGRDRDTILNQAKYRGQEVGKNLCEAFYVHRFII